MHNTIMLMFYVTTQILICIIHFVNSDSIFNNSYNLSIVELRTDHNMTNAEQGTQGIGYNFQLSGNKSTSTLKYNYTVGKKLEDRKPIQVFVSSLDATAEKPVLFGIRQQLGITSWQIPLEVHNKLSTHKYKTAGRTLCPIWNYGTNYSEIQNIILHVSTDSTKMTKVSVALIQQTRFFLRMNEETSFSATPSNSKYFEGVVPDNMDYIRLTLFSENNHCAVISIQPVLCPVHDLEYSVKFVGDHLTMTRKSAGSDFTDRKFYVVVVVLSNDLQCKDDEEAVESTENIVGRKKSFKLKMEEVLSLKKILIAIFVLPALVLCLCIFTCVIHYLWKKPLESQEEDSSDEVYHISVHYETETSDTTPEYINTPDSISTDMSPTTSSSDGRRIKKKKHSFHQDEIDNIHVFVDEIGETENEFKQRLLLMKKSSGNLDVCYYNNLCMHQWGIVSDLNHLISNILYVIVGFTFICIILIRYYRCQSTDCKHNKNVAHFEPWVFSGMGIGLIGEGIMSSCYHICPNKSNFLFDTSFMYLLAALCMVKTYHFRRPAMGMNLGVNLVLDFVLFSSHYWMFFVNYTHLYQERTEISALYGLVMQPDGFATHLLGVFIGNLIMYITYYLIMKAKSSDTCCLSSKIFRHFTVYYATLALTCWIPAMYYFVLRATTKWNVSPAESRAINQPCIFLGFYDAHDVWHFLSAGGLFFSFLMIVTMDDDIINMPKKKIASLFMVVLSSIWSIFHHFGAN
uniref:Uncharacterized protein n=1 Tax=Strigamia maritima TaxID=126957 RepID=T1IHA9_STRMM